MNGARGAVESFDSEGYPVVRFIGGKKEAVKMEKWQVGLALRHGATLSCDHHYLIRELVER